MWRPRHRGRGGSNRSAQCSFLIPTIKIHHILKPLCSEVQCHSAQPSLVSWSYAYSHGIGNVYTGTFCPLLVTLPCFHSAPNTFPSLSSHSMFVTEQASRWAIASKICKVELCLHKPTSEISPNPFRSVINKLGLKSDSTFSKSEPRDCVLDYDHCL